MPLLLLIGAAGAGDESAAGISFFFSGTCVYCGIGVFNATRRQRGQLGQQRCLRPIDMGEFAKMFLVS